MKICQIKPWIDNAEIKSLSKLSKTKFLTENKYTQQFEKKISKIVRSKYTCTFNNWTSGLFSCLYAFDINRDHEVIVPNITFVATINAVLLTGAKVVLCEIDEKTLCLDVKKLKRLITRKTKAIIPVHLYGNCCNMDEIKNIIKDRKIKLIEDAAQAFGVKYNNTYAGLIGDVGGYSFYGNKLITCGEGGAAVTNNRKLHKRLYQIKNHGRSKKGVFKHETIGFNFSFTEMQSLIGLSQLSKLSKILKKKQYIYNNYKKFLNRNFVEFVKIEKNTKPVHWFTNIIVKRANELENFLKKNGIQTRRLFYPINLQTCYLKNKKYFKNLRNDFSTSLKVYNKFISLPSAHDLNLIEIKKICKLINKFYLSTK